MIFEVWDNEDSHDSVSVWECLRCSSWVMCLVCCFVHHCPSHPYYLGRRVLLMPTRLKRLESTGSLGWYLRGHPSQIEAVSHWLFWMCNYGKHGRSTMFSNFVTIPVYDCDELLVYIWQPPWWPSLETGPAADFEKRLLKWAVPNETVGW